MFILASIVEKETSIKNEKPLISGVFYNRLNKNMRLQSDPTVIYSITEGKYRLKRNLTRKDLKFKSAYNTYVNQGPTTFNYWFSWKRFSSFNYTSKKKRLIIFCGKKSRRRALLFI